VPPDSKSADKPAVLAASPAAEAADARPLKVALVGVPNTGKSLLYHRLAKKFTLSANYPYTTTNVEQAKVRLGGREVVLIDTPGVTGLELCSEDEALTRKLLRTDPPDVIIQCIDAGNLVRSLILSAQLADLEIPTAICLTMVDDALGRGVMVDSASLSDELGVPVQAACALDGRGIQRLVACVSEARRPRQVEYPDWLRAKLAGLTPVASQAHQIQALLDVSHPDLSPGQSIWHSVLEAHRHWATAVAKRVIRTTGLEPQRTIWEDLADVALHPVGAWVFLAMTVVAVYMLVAKLGVGVLANGMDRYIAQPVLDLVGSWTGPGALHDILVGPFGLLSLGLFNAMGTVLPILAVFYLVTGFLEDIGYFPLLSVQFDRLLRFLGLTGRAVLPITLGFGCNTMATMATRFLPTDRQRFIACFLIALGIPCAVQLGVIVAILSTVPVVAILGLLAVVIVLQVIVGSTLAFVLPKSERGEFLVELPPLRRPQWGQIVARTRHRLVEFFLEACPMFLVTSAVMLALHFTGLLERIRDLFAPVVGWGLGMPREFTDVLLMTLARREVGAVMFKETVDAGTLNLEQIFVGLLVMTLFVPCMTNVLLLGRVVGWRRTVVIFVSVTLIAIGVGILANALWR
jgi:ferrous iron transport protein B